MRAKMKEFMKQELFIPQYNISIGEERKLALTRLQAVCSQHFFSVKDFFGNPDRIFAAHEIAAYADGSMATKMTVQFNLFGGSILKIGTQPHHDRLLNGIDRLKDIGCFGLTELGYGNNAVEMETTATYDPHTQHFTIHTPSTLAQKYWITNSSQDAKWCIVFAHLIIGKDNHGIHGFLVQIRDEKHQIMPNVRIEDM
jgi:acyl-CoA oxidase